MFEPIRQTRAQPRRQWPLILGVVGAAFLSLIGLMTLGAGAIARREADTAQAKIALAEMRATIDRLGRAGEQPVAIDTRVKATGVAGQAEGVVKQYAAEVAGDKRDYIAELTALGFPAMLKAPSLARENLGGVHANLVKARAVVAKYRALNEKRIADYRKAFASIDLTPEQRDNFESTFAANEPQHQALRTRLWFDEDALLGQFDQMVTLLERNRSQWLFDGHMLRFRNPALLAAYNADIASARRLAADERDLRNQVMQTADSKFDSLMSGAN